MNDGIWLMPFASISLASYWKLRKENINVAGFIDNAKGSMALTFDGLKVVHPRDIDVNSPVLISSLKYGERMKLQLIEQGFNENNIQFSNDMLTVEDMIFAKTEAKRRNIEYEYPIKRMDVSFDLYINSFNKLFNTSNQLCLTSPLEFVVTHRCTLKCKECSNLLQYYTDPMHIELRTILKSIDQIFKFVDYMGMLTVLGGEPFLVKDLDAVFDRLVEYRDKIGDLIVVTNGTIVPSVQVRESIKRANARVVISDYGAISRRKNELINILTQECIKYEVRFTEEQWRKHNYFTNGKVWSDDEADKIFCECRAFWRQVVNGKLGWCSYIANGEVLKAFPKEAYSTLNLFDDNLTKKQVADYFNRKHAFPACKHCHGIVGELEYIPVAEQIDDPLPYKVWE